ncbi:hypothetical protein OIU78_006969 [Salix suchowensis]|nr:hypothetical protein OIU78_006969 [Salix suchowensis]
MAVVVAGRRVRFWTPEMEPRQAVALASREGTKGNSRERELSSAKSGHFDIVRCYEQSGGSRDMVFTMSRRGSFH